MKFLLCFSVRLSAHARTRSKKGQNFRGVSSTGCPGACPGGLPWGLAPWRFRLATTTSNSRVVLSDCASCVAPNVKLHGASPWHLECAAAPCSCEREPPPGKPVASRRVFTHSLKPVVSRGQDSAFPSYRQFFGSLDFDNGVDLLPSNDLKASSPLSKILGSTKRV